LYAEWSSIPLYSAEENESSILLTALSFEDLAKEAELALNFDDLIKSDFFGRLRLFKESIAELFFAPTVTAAAIECNVRIGNMYVDLIDKERRKSDPATVHQRFGDVDDHIVSEAAGRTLELVEILKERGMPIEDDEPIVHHDSSPEVDIEPQTSQTNELVEVKPVTTNGFAKRLKEQVLSINRWILAGGALLIAVSIGFYIWGNYYAEPAVLNTGVKTLSFQGTDFADTVKTAKLSGETLYVVARPTVDSLTKDGQAELLQKLYQAGNEKGWTNVNLMNSQGKTIGFASPKRIEIVAPEN